MYSFFVLGLIPGTSIQITFLMWLDAALLLLAAGGIVSLYRIHFQMIDDMFARRTPLPASQLHQRLSLNTARRTY